MSLYWKALLWCALVVVALGLIPACSNNGDDDCGVAVAGCACYHNGTCEPGYVCGADGFCTGLGNAGGTGGDSGFGGNSTGGTSGNNDHPPGCESGWLNCNGCVNPNDNPLHCGNCDQPCPTGFVCEAGQCRDGGDCTVNPCSGFSYCDLLSKQCMPGCGTNTQCALNEICDLTTHACICPQGFHDCNGACVANDSTATCGSSCTACPSVANSTTTCDGTGCGLTCNEGFFACGGNCYLGSGESAEACGPTCTPCTAPPGATASCINGQCSSDCTGGQSVNACGPSCEPCNTVENGTAACIGGSCQYSCNVGYVSHCGRCYPSDIMTAPNAGFCTTSADCCDELPQTFCNTEGYCVRPYQQCASNNGCASGATCMCIYGGTFGPCQAPADKGYCAPQCNGTAPCPKYLPSEYPNTMTQCSLAGTLSFKCYIQCGPGIPCPAGWACDNGRCYIY
jgi:hypothetical protein